MHKFEVIDNKSGKWDELVKKAESYDFHHTAYFHKIDTDFISKLLCLTNGDSFIALPIIIRPIEHADYFDITSVYGYAGPIYRFEDDKIRKYLVDLFQMNFIDFCDTNKIVSVFSRLHPLIEQNFILNGLGDIIKLNKTVTIDLTLSPDEQRKAYRKSLKSELNQLRRKGIVVKRAENKEEIDKFIAIYYQTMDRVSATPNYYFSKDYFYKFLNNDGFKAILLIAIKDSNVIAGAIFTVADKIMQYHLAGTTDSFIKIAPMKLIIDEARLLGNTFSVCNFHLGGGVGGRDDDPLFMFKSGFSKVFNHFSVWKYVTNEVIYKQLSSNREDTSFFPLYRK